jgi:pilus assembly protein CpaF
VARLSTGERKITRVSELGRYRNGEYTIEDIFVYRFTGVADGRVQGSFYATGYEPQSLKRLAAVGFEMPARLFEARELTDDG